MTDDFFLDKIRGCFFGTAIGDALGYAGGAVEFDSTIYPSNRKVFLESVPDTYSDDTQMTRCVAEGLIRAGGSESVDSVAEEIAEEFIVFGRGPPEGHRAPGGSCMHGCSELARGTPWREAGRENGGGCGAAMRSAPYGLWHWADHLKAGEWAYEHAHMTHQAKIGTAAAAAVAAGIATAALPGNDDPLDVWGVGQAMVLAAGIRDDLTCSFLKDAQNYALKVDGLGVRFDDAVLDRFRGWTGHEAAAGALYALTRHPSSFADAVLLAVNSPGDSDSLGAITGALSGTWLGYSSIPEHWREQVEGREWLESMSVRFYESMMRAGVIDAG